MVVINIIRESEKTKMEEKYNSQNEKEKISKEELARRIAGNISARGDYDVTYREDMRRRSNVHTEFVGSRSSGAQGSHGNPYAKSAKGSNGSKSKSSSKKKKKKKKKQKRVLSAVIAFTVLIAAVGVGAGIWYSHGMKKYEGVFLDNTYINGTDVSGKSVSEAVELVIQDSDMPDVITFTKPDGNDVTVKLKDIGLTDNVTSSVTGFYGDQNHMGWFTAKTNKSEYNFKVKFDFDRDLLDEEIQSRIIDGQKDAEPVDAYIQRTDTGFEIVPEVVGTAISEDKVDSLYEYIDGFLDRGEYSINLSNSNCYSLPKVRSSDLKEQLNKLNSLYDMEFTFDFTYTTEVLSGSEVLDWITFDNEDASLGYTVDEDKAMKYVEELADKYDTYGKDRTFNSTSRGEITVEQGEGDYGWWIDQEKTCALLVDLIEEGVSATTEPYYYTSPESQYSYTCDPSVRTADGDIGDTYCEIDLAEQHFWYYKNGELKYECDIVSGKPTDARNTPGGVYKIWYKELNKVLSGTNSAGESWSTPVTYWNNISTIGVGLHDATWLSSFGGSIYKTNGSHGCINMPVAAAKYIYENIDYNTPVVMYW
jgi:hypothetical protein